MFSSDAKDCAATDFDETQGWFYARYSKTLQNKGGNAVWSTSSRFK
ncbi:hypothetical protein CHK_1036 [Christensenella hongkongensis]|uniref:Uncharacterized protein n=1 Tax=Christensenella hongkongensis TaxID=270498 RepID=A0A0M2NG95_9FIRM|nr:hypothetical protein CHK_1036 [Christensenella hongkongensis]